MSEPFSGIALFQLHIVFAVTGRHEAHLPTEPIYRLQGVNCPNAKCLGLMTHDMSVALVNPILTF